MALGRDYDWSGAMSQYGGYLSDYYSNINKGPDFLDYLLAVAPMAAMFIPGLGPAAAFGIGTGLKALGSMKRGQVPQPDWQTLYQLMQPKPSLENLGDIMQTGEGVISPEDINQFGAMQPDWINWDALERMIAPGQTPSIGGAGPMSIPKDIAQNLPPTFVRSPYNKAMRQLDLQRTMNLAYPQPGSPYGKPPWWAEDLTPEQIQQYQKKQVRPTPKEPRRPGAAILKSQRKVRWQRLKTKIDTRGQHMLTPSEWETWKPLNAEFGGEGELTTQDISKRYMTYVAGMVKQNETAKRKIAIGETAYTIQPIMPLDEYITKFKQTGIAPKPLLGLPPVLLEELRKFDSYDEWYNNLSGADKGLITADEIEAIKTWFMNR